MLGEYRIWCTHNSTITVALREAETILMAQNTDIINTVTCSTVGMERSREGTRIAW